MKTQRGKPLKISLNLLQGSQRLWLKKKKKVIESHFYFHLQNLPSNVLFLIKSNSKITGFYYLILWSFIQVNITINSVRVGKMFILYTPILWAPSKVYSPYRCFIKQVGLVYICSIVFITIIIIILLSTQYTVPVTSIIYNNTIKTTDFFFSNF